MGCGANDLLTLAPGKFVKEAEVGSAFVARLLSVVTAPAGIVFVRLPFTVIVALSVRVHDPRAGRLPPLKTKELSPGFPVIAPPQLPTLKFAGLARIIPAGILSGNAIPVSGVLFGLIRSMLIVEEAPPKTCGG